MSLLKQTANTKKSLKVVIFDANGGDCEESERVVQVGCSVGDLPIPLKDNYKFLGWFTELDAGIEVNSTFIAITSMVIYAHWLNNTKYSISVYLYPAITTNPLTRTFQKTYGEEFGTFGIDYPSNNYYLAGYNSSSNTMPTMWEDTKVTSSCSIAVELAYKGAFQIFNVTDGNIIIPKVVLKWGGRVRQIYYNVVTTPKANLSEATVLVAYSHYSEIIFYNSDVEKSSYILEKSHSTLYSGSGLGLKISFTASNITSSGAMCAKFDSNNKLTNITVSNYSGSDESTGWVLDSTSTYYNLLCTISGTVVNDVYTDDDIYVY